MNTRKFRLSRQQIRSGFIVVIVSAVAVGIGVIAAKVMTQVDQSSEQTAQQAAPLPQVMSVESPRSTATEDDGSDVDGS